MLGGLIHHVVYGLSYRYVEWPFVINGRYGSFGELIFDGYFCWHS